MRANPNLLAVLGFLLLAGGVMAYLSLPAGGDRGFLIMVIVPIATTMLGGSVLGTHLNDQDAALKTIQRQTNGTLDRKIDEVAHEAASKALSLHADAQKRLQGN